MIINRVWAMAATNGDTFDCKPLGEIVRKYLVSSKLSIEPFARNRLWATYTNDLNPATKAEYHLDSLEFLKLMRSKNVRPDLVIFDPPYSPRQIKELYDGIGMKMGGREALRSASWKAEKDVIDDILMPEGIVICFGWNSGGMGINRHYSLEEVLLVCHGAGHNDTIVTVEKKVQANLSL